jgi:pimeloyl-ACP methyl ester carboxylesterase
MASAVYEPPGQRHANGYTEVTDRADLEKLGLVPEELDPTDSEFQAAVFREDGTKNYVIAFKGTTMDSVSDWEANLAQSTIGYSDYYQRAKLIARDTAAKIGSGDVNRVKFVGHSLGGGLASAAAHATGQPATTFNAAGLHLFNRNWFSSPPIDAVRVNGEILTGLQSSVRRLPLVIPEARGTPYSIDPPPTVASTASRVSLDKWDAIVPGRVSYKYGRAAIARAVELHGMASVTPALREKHAVIQREVYNCRCRC